VWKSIHLFCLGNTFRLSSLRTIQDAKVNEVTLSTKRGKLDVSLDLNKPCVQSEVK